MAAGLGAQSLQEYLVSLGVKLDEKGMTKMEGFLKSSKMGFLALTGIMVTAATVATKWVKQINEAELAYAKEAKAHKKSIETIRASDNALKAMGKTKQEVAKDKSLKAVYDDLVKMNKAMALPDGSRGLSLVRTIGQEFLKFKATIQYAMQWINYHIISKLEGPLTRIRDTMKDWRETLQREMPLWTAKIADGIAVLVRLLETAVRFGGEVIKFIQKLPTELKVMGAAIYGLWNIIRAGPLGWLLGGLTALLLLLDDFYAYKNGEPSAFAGLWEGLDDGSFSTKIVGLAQKGINSFVEFMKSDEVQTALNEVVKILLGTVGALINGAVAILMNSMPKSIQDFLGWDANANDGAGGWKTDQRDVPVVSKGKEVIVEDQGEEPSRDHGVVYKNTNGILHPILSKEYRDLPIDQVPQSVIDSLNYHNEHFGRGGEALLEMPEYEPSIKPADSQTDTTSDLGYADALYRDAFLKYLDGTNDENTPYQIIPEWEHFPLLKEAYGNEAGFFANGDISKEYFNQVVDALLKGAIGDFRNDTEFFSVNHQYLQWYEAYKNGTLVPPPPQPEDQQVEGSISNSDVNASIQYDPTQVTQATGEAVKEAQGAVTPITVPIVPTFGAGGEEEHYNPPDWGTINWDFIQNAQGGRYDRPVASTLSEDNEPEYVIPIKKLNRAIPLIRMMLAEIGEKGRQMLSDFGITPDTDIDALVASKGLGRPGGGSPIINVVNNYNYTNTVNAPSTFNINGSGNDPQAIGQAAYNAQERNLVRALKAVVQSE